MDKTKKENLNGDDGATVTLQGRVEKVIPSVDPREPDKAQIAVEGGDELYREIRIENALKDSSGRDVVLKPGAEVDVTIQADETDVQPRESAPSSTSKSLPWNRNQNGEGD